ncbi:glycoside hydrolase family protein [Lactobacillaceae bacterium Scapto_B20]
MKLKARFKKHHYLKWLMVSTATLTLFGLTNHKQKAAADIFPEFNLGTTNAVQLAQSQVNRAATLSAQAVGQVDKKQQNQFYLQANVANNTIATNPLAAVPLGQNAADTITQNATDLINSTLLKKTFVDAYINPTTKLYDNPVDNESTDSVIDPNAQVQTADYEVNDKVPTMYNNNVYYVKQTEVSAADTASPLNKNTFTQRYHYNIPTGFMNDIQSIIKVGDHWNIYYLSNDQKDTGSNTEWALVQTKDFKAFKNVGIAIPRNTGGWQSVATGSIMLNDQNGHIVNSNLPSNAMLAFFTGFSQGRQNVYEAYSTDGGVTFSPAQSTPLMTQYNNGGAFRILRCFGMIRRIKLLCILQWAHPMRVATKLQPSRVQRGCRIPGRTLETVPRLAPQ